MKKILVLVDFSAPSLNAADYAADLAMDEKFEEITLWSNCHVPLFEQIVPTADLIQVDAETVIRKLERTKQQLQTVRTGLEKRLPATVKINLVVATLPLLRAVLEQVADERPDLVVLGSSRRDTWDDCSIGRQLVALAKVIPIPLLVVPPESTYRHVETALMARSPAEASQPIPVAATDSVLRLFRDVHYSQYTPEKKDILQGVLNTAAEMQVQLIIALPGKHSFFYHLTHQNIMHGIFLNAEKPVLILK